MPLPDGPCETAVPMDDRAGERPLPVSGNAFVRIMIGGISAVSVAFAAPAPFARRLTSPAKLWHGCQSRQGRPYVAVNCSMIKSELIAKLAEDNPHLHQRDVERIVSTIFDEITGALSKGERVELRGFGAFSVKRRPARVGRNPRTGDSVQVDEKYVPFFKTGKELRERLNES